ncbi:ABC transporter permease [Thermovibrio ammonificans]|jgi:peptide/nickel transport system permease protein|uniref:Binding-protein-dependent transport systems inner membrane component n=1 Tax=Thermovibrio ammonificans (strain DSM 15698 / JCM 12110 / HB-1) TaxID=648996 RepID=E8T587_THEA1|nr:ABC transporter permease [Thermovibrio ammonificans]ADU96425.1 binding-protein-dependent transport systems inner membrane component [Thermovibrio ammonificans HB-1]
MLRYLLKRLLQMVPLVIGMTFISFVVIKLAPGDFLTRLELNPSYSKETIQELRRLYGLDQNIFVQYLHWLKNALVFNLGYSFAYHKPVLSLIEERLLNTLELTVTSFVLSWLLAVPLGIVAAVYRGKLLDRAITLFSLFGISVPNFFLAFLLMFFAAKTGLFPIGGVVSQNYSQLPWYGKILDRLWHMAIPLTVLVVGSIAGLLRLVRSTVLEELGKDYVKVAIAKGLPYRRVVLKHAFRNALNPFLTLIGFDIAGLLSGAALVEIITAWPGMGRLMFEAVMAQDLFVVMGSLYIGGIMLVIGNLIADLLLALNDPRIREREVEGRVAR